MTSAVSTSPALPIAGSTSVRAVGGDLDRLLAEHEARDVEIVDHHVAIEPAGASRCRRPAAARGRARRPRRSRPCRWRPSRRASCSAEKFGSKRRLKPIISGLPARLDHLAGSSRRAWRRGRPASRRSTALPALTPASIRSACVSVGVPISIASMSFGRDDCLQVAHLRAGRLGEPRGGRLGRRRRPRPASRRARSRCSARGSGRCGRRRAVRNEA